MAKLQESRASGGVPAGLTLRHTLGGHTGVVSSIAWSPDGQEIISASKDRTIKIWDLESGGIVRTLKGHGRGVNAVAVTADGRAISASADWTVRIWDLESNQNNQILGGSSYAAAVLPDGRGITGGEGDSLVVWDLQKQVRVDTFSHPDRSSFYDIAVAPDGRVITGSRDHKLLVWKLDRSQPVERLVGHTEGVGAVAVLPDGRAISGSDDSTLIIWDLEQRRAVQVLEGHTHNVDAVAPSHDGRVVASKSADGTVRLWDCETWQTLAVLEESSSQDWPVGLSFHPSKPVLATLGDEDTSIRIWDLDYDLLCSERAMPAPSYVNAKVVLVGDTGVGKTGLGLVLTGQNFQPTESSHGRHVWLFEREEIPANGEQGGETRETLLWDLAGQPGYRLVHQLHLNEVAIALVVCDARHETDPFAGVRHWDRALRQAAQVQDSVAPPLKKYLVVSRADRGGVGVNRRRIDRLVADLGFECYFETSAKEGWGTRELGEAIREGISWKALPRVSSTELFTSMKAFLIAAKESGRLLSTAGDLRTDFMAHDVTVSRTGGDLLRREATEAGLEAAFETCLGRVEARGLVRCLSFGDLVLLQPERLDAYASAMVNAAKDEPDGLGSLAEDDARAGRFRMSDDERIGDDKLEQLMLIATVEDLLRHEIALREHTDDGVHLVFPSQFTRDWPEAPESQGQAVIFTFEGPVLNIYATLAIRLSHSGRFERVAMWRNAASYASTAGGTCGLYLRELQEGKGEITLFFAEDTEGRRVSEQTTQDFERYIEAHLERRALGDTVSRRRIFPCPKCDEPVPDRWAQIRLGRGLDSIRCAACDTEVPLVDALERLEAATTQAVTEMDREADSRRDREVADSVIQGKRATGDFDVFLCHHSQDKPKVIKIANQLMERGILPWLDVWDLQPGLPWQAELEKQIENVKAAAVFVGPSGVGPWQEQEQAAFLREFVKRQCPVIPVRLPGRGEIPNLPVFLGGMTWVNFRQRKVDPLQHLIWGITGEKPRRR